jgi:hypothetical protein
MFFAVCDLAALHRAALCAACVALSVAVGSGDALDGRFHVVLAEALDRFSRDQEDTAGLFKRLTFAGVNIVTLAEGDITHLHVGLKGTMNALFLKDLADKTRRGLRGRVELGKSGGDLCYGYRVRRATHAHQQIAVGRGEHDGACANERAVLADRQELHFAVGKELSQVRRGACQLEWRNPRIRQVDHPRPVIQLDRRHGGSRLNGARDERSDNDERNDSPSDIDSMLHDGPSAINNMSDGTRIDGDVDFSCRSADGG